MVVEKRVTAVPRSRETQCTRISLALITSSVSPRYRLEESD